MIMSSVISKKDIDKEDEKGQTVLHQAVLSNNYDQVAKVLKKGAFVDYADKEFFRPMHYAARNQNLEIVKLLYEAGANPSAFTGTKTGILHFLCRIPKDSAKKRNDLLNYLLLKFIQEDGADINLRNEDGRCPIHEAAAVGSDETVKTLMKMLAKLDVKDRKGETALHLAMRNERVDIIRTLLEGGANPFIKNNEGNMPFDLLPTENPSRPSIQSLINQASEKMADAQPNCHSGRFDVIAADDFDQLPIDIREMVEGSGVPVSEIQTNMALLLRILGFIIKKKSFVYGDGYVKYKTSDPSKIYKKIEKVGAGGFGEVTHYRHVENKQLYAIKTVSNVTTREKERNLREVLLLNYLTHPNVVRFIEAYDFKGEIWIVQEYLEGGTLESAYKIKKFSESELSYVARQILRALIYLHTMNIVHRDLKTTNVMLTPHADVKLIDFGLAVSSEPPQTSLVGSAAWLAPEVVRQQPYGTKADIWSLGIILVEMANQKLPYRSNLKSMMKAMEGITPPINFDRYSNHFTAFLSCCLQVNPDDRKTAFELIQHHFIRNGPAKEEFKLTINQVAINKMFID